MSQLRNGDTMKLSRRSFAAGAGLLAAATALPISPFTQTASGASPVFPPRKPGSYNQGEVFDIWSRRAKLTGRDGKPRQIGCYPDMAVMLNFWAYWCPNCVGEFAAMNALWERCLTPERKPRLGTILISQPQNWEKDKALADARGIGFPLWRFENNLSDEDLAYGLLAPPPGNDGMVHYQLPITLIVARNGRAMDMFRGAQDWTSPDIISRVDRMVNA